MRPISENQLELEYTLAATAPAKAQLTDGGDSIRLMLWFDPVTRGLERAEVSGNQVCSFLNLSI